MNRQIFREYDIRGVIDKDLKPQIVHALGRAFGTTVKRNGGKKVSVGYDARLSSPTLNESLTNGIRAAGVDVISIGLVPTPLLYYSIYHLHTDGGVMITGSHNPPEFNGFKLNLGKGSIYGAGIQALADLIEKNDFETGAGSITKVDVIEDYIKMVKSKITLSRKPRIVIDAGNGCGGIFAPRLMRELGCEVIELFCEVDGTFPNHHPDPTVPKNLSHLIAKVRETGAEVGIGYDGDADRIGVVDEKGGIIWGDKLMVIFSRAILESAPGATIVGEVKCSQVMYDEIAKAGGKPVMWKTGHSLIKAKMKELGAAMAGEMSGHIFFADKYYGFDDAVYASARLVEIMAAKRAKDPKFAFSTLLAGVPDTIVTPELRVDCPDDMKFDVITRLDKAIGAGTPELVVKDIIRIDGLRINFSGGWALVRASNTQPVLVLRFEAASERLLETAKAFIRQKMTESNPMLTVKI